MSNTKPFKNSSRIEEYSNRWLMVIGHMKEHGVIDTKQHKELSRKIKGWWYDRMEELEGLGDE